MTTSCSPSWLRIKLTLYSVSVGEGWAISRLACKCGHLCVGHLQRFKQARESFYAGQTRCTARADFVVAPGNLKSP
ncbi:MAG: hypothetical protein RL302_2124 [Pseudomonadota bacterium]|jgi:hypothetical protein